MQKVMLCCALLFWGGLLWAQNQENASEWIATTSFGIAELEREGEFKTNTNVYAVHFGRGFRLNDRFSIRPRIGLRRQSGNFVAAGESFFLVNQDLQIPVDVRYSALLMEKIAVYVDFGIYGSFLVDAQVEIAGFDDQSIDDNGFNLGAGVGFGILLPVGETVNFQLGMTSQSDFLNSYDDADFETTQLYAFQFGVGFQF
ncbi:outer membrane beta-barrel protein [Croceiramulus getboli]|nr:outer membrane beta-barrel protein [Flavobacteriaceae bacterium YJPT1-3]